MVIAIYNHETLNLLIYSFDADYDRNANVSS